MSPASQSFDLCTVIFNDNDAFTGTSSTTKLIGVEIPHPTFFDVFTIFGVAVYSLPKTDTTGSFCAPHSKNLAFVNESFFVDAAFDAFDELDEFDDPDVFALFCGGSSTSAKTSLPSRFLFVFALAFVFAFLPLAFALPLPPLAPFPLPLPLPFVLVFELMMTHVLMIRRTKIEHFKIFDEWNKAGKVTKFSFPQLAPSGMYQYSIYS